MKKNSYSQNGWSGSNFDSKLSAKDITSKIRVFVKNQYPECKFSVTKESFSGGSAINIALMYSPYEVRSEKGIANDYYLQCSLYGKDSQLNENGNEILKNVVGYANSFNYDDSDSMTDYFDTNFYLHFHVGTWQKNFQVAK